MKSIIIDDEEKSRQTLGNFLKKYCPEILIDGEADGVESGLQLISKVKPEVVFLDIQMKDGTGFDLLEKVMPIEFKVIFVTAYDQYALRAFKFSAVDYVLKPLDPSKLIEAVRKLKQDNQLEQLKRKIEVMLSNTNGFKKLALPSIDGLIMVKIKDIVRCESESNYTHFFMKSGDTFLSTKTLKEYDQMLTATGFYRIHQSHLINLGYVSRYLKGEGGTIILDDKTQLDVARRRKDGLMVALRKI